jgi:FkbM family methyltransferase
MSGPRSTSTIRSTSRSPKVSSRAPRAPEGNRDPASRAAELTLASVLRISPRTLPGRAALKTAIATRRRLVRHGDPLVRYRMGEYELLLPLSHELPIYRKDHPEYESALGRLAALAREKYANLTVVDVGANVGDTAAVIRDGAPRAPVLAVEGHPRFFDLLKRNAAQFDPPLDLNRAIVGPRAARVRAVFEAASGTAQLRFGGGDEVEVQTLSAVLGRHPRFAAPKLLKLDTDGHDWPILRAESDLLARVRPLLFAEYDPHLMSEDDHEVLPLLRAVGYARALVYENTGEYADAIDLADAASVADLRERYAGFGGARYADLALFHAEDLDLAVRAEERERRA